MRVRVCKHCGSQISCKGLTCYKCRYKIRKQKDPQKVAYYTLKNNAKRRGKEFFITLEQFREFCVRSNYLHKKGIQKFSYHIDRIDETKGYTVENLQLLTNIDNVKKYIRFVEINEQGQKVFTTEVERVVDWPDCPF